MGLDAIESEIRKKNDEKVSSIISNAEKEAKVVVNKAREQIFELKKARALEIQRLSKEHRDRELAQASLNARKLKLDVKKDAVEELYQKINGKLLELPDSEKKGVLEALMQRGKSELENAYYVFCNSSDKAVVADLCKKYGLEFSGVVDSGGGIIVETKSREVRIDYTYESLLLDFRKATIDEAANQLFGEKK